VFAALLPICAEGGRPDAATLATTLDEQDRRLLFDIAFEPSAPPDWDEAESCLGVQRRKRAEVELMAVQKEIEVHSARSSAQAAAAGAPNRLNELLARKQELRKRLGDA
jgi:hypothetical protein